MGYAGSNPARRTANKNDVQRTSFLFVYVGQDKNPLGFENRQQTELRTAVVAAVRDCSGDWSSGGLGGHQALRENFVDLRDPDWFLMPHGVFSKHHAVLANALNHTNLGTPNRFVNTSSFGSITEVATPGREIQVSARVSF